MAVSENSLLCNRYRLQRSIGRGGMAEVFLAFDLKRQAPVAVKILREDLAEEPDFGKRFRREAELLATLDHPNIVRFYAFEQDGPTAFIVMDYIDGITVRRRLLERQGPLPVSEITDIVRGLTSALHYAHLNGFIHRDLKPGNVMLKSDGKVMLTDFGISCALEGVTQTAAGLGTPAYMSPEQVATGDTNAASDIYSLGVLLFELATGRRPFTGDEPGLTKTNTTLARVREAHLILPPPNPRGLNPYLPAAAAGVILKALAKRPQDRWPDAISLRKAWEEAVGAQTLTDIPIPPPKSQPKPKPEPPVRPRPGPVKPPPPRSRLPYIVGGALMLLAVVLLFALLRPQPTPPQAAAPTVTVAAATEAVAVAPSPTKPPAATGGVRVIVPAANNPPAVATATGAATVPTAPAPMASEPTIAPTPSAGGASSATADDGQTGGNASAGAGTVATLPPATGAGGVTLLYPPDGARIEGETEFAWQPDAGFALAAGESYELIVWGAGQDPLAHGRSPVGAWPKTAARVNLTGVEAALQLQSDRTYYWGVRLWRDAAGGVRMLSEGRSFVYARAGGIFTSPLPGYVGGGDDK